MNPENVSDALRILADAAIWREKDLANYSKAVWLWDTDEDNDSGALILDIVCQQGGSVSIMKTTHFDVDQLMTVDSPRWHDPRTRRNKLECWMWKTVFA